MRNRKPKSAPKSRDPIVAGVHKVRDAFARRQGYDVDKIISAVQAEMQTRAKVAPVARRVKKAPARRRRAV